MKTKALMLGNNCVIPDNLMCSSAGSSEPGGIPCLFSIDGQMPDPMPLKSKDANYSIDKGQPGDLCPPCAKQQLSHLGHWQGHHEQVFPCELLPLRLFKCRMGIWLVVPGLLDAAPTQITPAVGENAPTILKSFDETEQLFRTNAS